ncbi:SDR family NAD(P)-dependent oxidoreductase [Aquimarina latercula]|uniref:SDR family NAD(P)-dependent oxidoreductase n=1 Tax=Aquimarina latercula TaxID=987 RepID=UPI0003F7E421|nr:SDR family NAD(P)-dependent oxidoreductase [Aquimarina latercula]
MANKNVIWCDEKTLSKDLRGKTYIVTGANSGVGFETAKQLVKQGAHVVMACRRTNAGEVARENFKDLKGTSEVMKCDLGDLQSVRSFVTEFLNKHDKLDGLDCNAGLVVMGNQAKYTKDDLEETIGVSYFAHFLLTELLLDVLESTEGSRMVILSSVVHANSPKKRYKINFEDINWKDRKYSAFDAYGEAKVASVLYAMELAERLKDTSVTTYSVHPGWARSNFGKEGPWLMTTLIKITQPFLKSMTNSNWESAQTSLHCLISDDAPRHSGKYFSQHSTLYNDKECKKGGWPMETPNPNAKDMNQAKKLVEMSRALVNLN